jgi:LuxR family maltose regulon positive regulatory protein
VLAGLARANAFVEESAGAPGGYRIHPLFREMLLAELGYEHPGEVARLRRTCAAWYADEGMVVEAVGHAVAAGDWAFVARLLVDDLVIARLLAHGSDAMLRGVRQPPDDAPTPEAAVLRAAMAVAAGTLPTASDLAAAEAAVDGGDRPALRASAALTCLAAVTAEPGDGAALPARIATAEAALRGLPDGARGRREYVALLAAARGLGAVSGDAGTDDILAAVRAAAGAAQAAGTRRLRSRAVGLLAVLEALAGNLTRAAAHAAEAESLCADGGTEETRRCQAAAVAAATVELQRYSLVDARDWLSRAQARRQAAEDSPEAEVLDTVTAVLHSRSLRLRREYDAADDALRARPADGAGPRWVRQLVLAEAVRLAFSRGRVEEGLRMADAAGLEPGEQNRLLALGHLLRGDGAAVVQGDGGAPAAAVESRVVRACQLAESGAVTAAADELARALELARPELLRLPFVDAPPQARRLLRGHPRLVVPAGWLNPSAQGAAAPRAAGAAAAPAAEAPALTQDLSERETEVLQHLAEMLSTAEIAATMFISVNTVRTHIRSILRKLGVSRRNQAVRRARERGLL